MKSLRFLAFSVLLMGALVGCRGSKRAATDAGSSVASSSAAAASNKVPVTQVTLRVEKEPPRIAAGAALAKAVTISKAKDTPERHKLVVYVFDAAATPAPTCATIASGSELFSVSGSYFTFTVDKAVPGPGTFDVSGVEWTVHTSDTNSKSGFDPKSLSVALTLQSYDARSFAGVLEAKPGSAADVSGSMAGTVCPPSTEQAVDETGFPLPTDDESSPPPPPPPPEKKPKGKAKPR